MSPKTTEPVLSIDYFLCFTAFSKTFKHQCLSFASEEQYKTAEFLSQVLFIYLLNTNQFLIGFNFPDNSSVSKPVGSDQIWKMQAIYHSH